MTKASDATKAEAIARLREWVKPSDTLYTVLRNVSRSGMSRRIDVYKMTDAGPHYLTGNVADAIGATFPSKGDGLRIDGCGMDMGFHVVYTLSYVLYPEYECVGEGSGRWEGCPSAAHDSGPDRDRYGAGVTHHDGYALRQRWL